MNDYVNWDKVPDVMSKEVFYKVCHISKATALELLESGKVPSQHSDNPSRYLIKKEDVMKYMAERKTFSSPCIDYSHNSRHFHSQHQPLTEEIVILMYDFYTELFKDQPLSFSVKELVALTEYRKATIVSWCEKSILSSTKSKDGYIISKSAFIDFLCSERCQAIVTKSRWHKKVLYDFEQSILKPSTKQKGELYAQFY